MSKHEEKQFREKPYTQCFECIQGSRLKCKQCMSSIIDEIIKDRHSTEAAFVKNVPMKIRSRKLKKENKNDFQVKTCYENWMNHV